MVPAKSQFAAELTENLKISDIFMVTQKSLALGRSNQTYLKLTLSDSSGQVEARAWQEAEALEKTFSKGDIVSIKGRVSMYQGSPQINIDALAKISEEDAAGLSWGDFLPKAEKPVDEMWNELLAHMDFIENPYLRALLQAFAEDEEFCLKFKNSSAARGIHHVYLGGLLEHTLNLVKLAKAVGSFYPLNLELLTMGAFLHDIGKTRELSYASGFDYTTEGHLLGHITIGVQLLTEKAAGIKGFPQLLLLHLNHLILSHHGELEWGSPKQPRSLEALLLHAIDNIDAKMTSVGELINKAEGSPDDWTSYSKALGRCFYRPRLSGPELGDGDEPIDSPAEQNIKSSNNNVFSSIPEASPEQSVNNPEKEKTDSDKAQLFFGQGRQGGQGEFGF